MKAGNSPTVNRKGPNDENTDAFVLTFRFFIQNNEPISLSNIKEIFHSNLATEQEMNRFDKARSNLKEYLSGNIAFVYKNGIKRGELMDTFIYGGLSHANAKKKGIYDEWMENEILASFMQNEFSVILYDVLNVILYIRNLSQGILDRINS
jgi:hypothetical protein